ncbi:putative alpha/beta hydrolase [Aspergillus steynii IBT 23096]|uniref:Putative alpha/beta hydrolase n=1 Tax=Aspergillus steynii IBT 23096 TaxID=1392250 RepID=A0A2I2GJV5_9EURO|nr:putative alpha/beta hydrolase [Aspergillus steynii IBT 23096]PLB53150.1 putative alpha/beta hydrolase [Aspergillus steynii IBT 23096]
MDFIATSLRERYPTDTFHILAAQRNAGNHTYDGIELGGERLALEIEETLDSLAARGSRIGKLSVVGYSLGGLVARYALGLLYARGCFEKLEPVNFTTFVSPHVGVRIPVKGLRSFLWNYLGPRTISVSGRQLFLVDSFRDSGKPLLSLLADPDSVFMRALAKFKRRCVYANVVNDRSTVFYTTAISLSDPFQQDLERAHIKYVAGYEPVVVDPDVYFALPGRKEDGHPLSSRIQQQTKKLFTDLSLWLFFTLLMLIALPIFLVNSIIQTSRSRQRIQLHEEGQSGASFGHYRIPLLIKDAQSAVEEVFERAAARQDPEYLSAADQHTGASQLRKRTSATSFPANEGKSSVLIREETCSPPDRSASQTFPTLALTPLQMSIIKSLNAVGFRKYPVYIHNHRHSHAAIIRRVPKKGFDEAPVVMKHWLDAEFEI